MAVLYQNLRKRGWVVERRSKHYKLTAPNGTVIFASSTPSDPRSILNTEARIRRAEQ